VDHKALSKQVCSFDLESGDLSVKQVENIDVVAEN